MRVVGKWKWVHDGWMSRMGRMWLVGKVVVEMGREGGRNKRSTCAD